MHGSIQVFVGCHNQADVYAHGLRAADSEKRLLLDGSQELNLGCEWHVADFIQENSLAFC